MTFFYAAESLRVHERRKETEIEGGPDVPMYSYIQGSWLVIRHQDTEYAASCSSLSPFSSSVSPFAITITPPTQANPISHLILSHTNLSLRDSPLVEEREGREK